MCFLANRCFIERPQFGLGLDVDVAEVECRLGVARDKMLSTLRPMLTYASFERNGSSPRNFVHDFL